MRPFYIVRVDDLCPTANWGVWNAVEDILDEYQVRPLVAVVPDNRDPVLCVGHCDSRFWDRVRSWQSRGWSIGMHGWQHHFETTDGGILGVNRYSEFAGLPFEHQKEKLRLAFQRFSAEGIRCDGWIAPAHSFDRSTLQILRDLGFKHISDGFFPLPCRDDLGLLWVPQQLWTFRRRPGGVWTVCLHVNRWSKKDVDQFRKQIAEYRPVISSFEEVVSIFGCRECSFLDRAAARAYRTTAVAFSRSRAAIFDGLLARPGAARTKAVANASD